MWYLLSAVVLLNSVLLIDPSDTSCHIAEVTDCPDKERYRLVGRIDRNSENSDILIWSLHLSDFLFKQIGAGEQLEVPQSHSL